MQDRNRKEIGLGDEVSVQFRVTGVGEIDGKPTVVLQTIHNRTGGNIRGTTEELAKAEAEIAPLTFQTEPFRVILQRKAPVEKAAEPKVA